MSEDKPPICANLVIPILIRPIIHKVSDQLRSDPNTDRSPEVGLALITANLSYRSREEIRSQPKHSSMPSSE